MLISELKAGQGNVSVEGTVKELGETRSFNKFGKQLTVANAILTDGSGSIKLTLWNDDVSRFKDGDKIKIVNGYVGEFQGEKQLTSGKFGSMEKLDGSQTELSSKDKSKDKSEETEVSDEEKGPIEEPEPVEEEF